ncbi:MAG: leucyl aminopeptidase [Pseudomonadales bacterium]|nr:leucyl aminopeptidase [Pseudomonadales bacterium]
MKYIVSTGALLKVKTDWLVIAVPSTQKISGLVGLEENGQQMIKGALATGDLKEEVGSTLVLRMVPGLQAKRLMLVSSGEKDQLSEKNFRTLYSAILTGLRASTAKSATISLEEIAVEGKSLDWLCKQMVVNGEYSAYQYDTTKKQPAGPVLRQITFLAGNRKQISTAQRAVDEGLAIANGVTCARQLGNLPGNICTPGFLAKNARALARKSPKLTVKIIDEKEMKLLKMGSFLSVSAGSAEPAKLIIFEYKGAAKTEKPHALVGKGVTFDSGGISLKPGAGMDEMKFDMCGAASVFGAMTSLIELAPKMNVVGIVGAVENMPSSTATKPGDVVTSMSGKTIEVLNTDAEGRLVLCDLLTYVERFKPQSVIDIATLTGACVVALGGPATGMFANDEALAEQLNVSGEASGDRVWRLPLWDDYQESLNSPFADIANVGGRAAGSITAACFLSRFTEDYRWAHLDIAGSAWISGGMKKGSTGRPVGLLVDYLLAQAG